MQQLPNPYAPQQLPQGQSPWPVQHATRCQACQRVAPTRQVTMMQNIGAIVLRFPRTIRGALCRRCIDSYFWKMTTITFFFGWWGIISFFYTLFSIPQNIYQLLASRDLPDA